MKTNTETHAKAERLLRHHGWAPVRQFEPKKDSSIGRGECFELWQRDSGNIIQQVFVQFYGDGHGVEFYFKGCYDNSWSSVEHSLNAPPSCPSAIINDLHHSLSVLLEWHAGGVAPIELELKQARAAIAKATT